MKVFRGKTPVQTVTLPGDTQSWRATGLSPKHRYRFTVSARSEQASTSRPAISRYVRPRQRPARPESVRSWRADAHRNAVMVAWTPGLDKAASYRVRVGGVTRKVAGDRGGQQARRKLIVRVARLERRPRVQVTVRACTARNVCGKPSSVTVRR